MADERHYVTPEGLEKLERELAYLRGPRRQEVAKRLHNALEEGGELGEDAEYEDAKNEQAFVEGEIARLETILSTVEIIDKDRPKDVVALGSFVTIREKGSREDEIYHLVGAAEADPTQGKISHKSPLGIALIGTKVNDKVVVDAPDGELVFTVRSIE